MIDFFTNIVDVFQIIFELIDKAFSHLTTFIVFVLELAHFQSFLLPVLPSILATSFLAFLAIGSIKLITGR